MVYSLRSGWRFHALGPEELEETRRVLTGGYTKTGAAAGPAAESFCDAGWERVSLPDDFLVREPFDRKGTEGFKPLRRAWYRRYFRVPAEWAENRLFLRFDGIATRAAVFLNGIRLADSVSAYVPLSAEITELTRPGVNVLAVCVDNDSREGWWYDGCGIYRDVFLTVTGQSLFRENGVFLSARKTDGGWRLTARAETDGVRPGDSVRLSCLGKSVEAPAAAVTALTLELGDVPLWSFDSPALVDVTAELLRGEERLDARTTPFGFRSVEFDADRGLLLNGRPEKLRGVCLHQDHAAVGTAVSYDLHLARLKRLKEMGCNAVRTAHNPQSVDFYRACDELGFAVLDETRHFSAAPEELRQLRELVRRDRNHPCVFFWSLFNEEPLQCTAFGERVARRMRRVVDEEDGTRPVTGGMNGPIECEGVVNAVDVMGFNYLLYGYDEFHARFPKLPVIGSENCSYRSQRGENRTWSDETQLRRSGFGLVPYTPGEPSRNLDNWSATPGETWRQVSRRPWVLGCFEWTGIDYRGEAIWPCVVNDSGALDHCAFPKESFWWNRALWRPDTGLHVSRYRDPERTEGDLVVVHASADTLRLTVDGSVGEPMPFDRFAQNVYAVPHGARVRVSVGTAEGETREREAFLPGEPVGLTLTCPGGFALEGGTAAFDAVLTDARGLAADRADGIEFFVENGSVLGSANGDSCCREIFGSRCVLFHGMAQTVVRAGAGARVTVRAVCGGFTAECVVPVRPAPVPELPPCPPRLPVGPWRMSDVTETYPDAKLVHDTLFCWIPTAVGVSESLMLKGKRGYGTLFARVSLPETDCALCLDELRGRCDVVLDGKTLLSRREEETGPIRFSLPGVPGGRQASLSLVFTLTGGSVRVGEVYLLPEE